MGMVNNNLMPKKRLLLRLLLFDNGGRRQQQRVVGFDIGVIIVDMFPRGGGGIQNGRRHRLLAAAEGYFYSHSLPRVG